jgi:serine/threonine protein kinase
LSGAPPDPIASEVDPFIGRTIGGKFAIQRLLGAGAMGAVYQAQQTALDRTVAIKVMRGELAFEPTFAARFQREAKSVSRLDHPNLIRILDYGQEPDGLLYIAMEFLDGRDLFRVLEEEWPFPHERIVDILAQVLSALADAHDAGVLHRDLKPENIMLLRRKSEDGNLTDVVKVCDFGIAKVQEPEAKPAPARGGRNLTAAGLVVGTPGYMSPEQARSEPCDARSDIYSVGVVLYQLLTRRLPFEGNTPLDVVVKALHEAPPPLGTYGPTAAPGLEPICVKAMAKRAEDRYASAREMRAALRAAQVVPRQVVITSSDRPSVVSAPTQAELVTNAPTTTARTTRPASRRSPVLFRLLGGLGLLIAIGVAATVFERRGSAPTGTSATTAALPDPTSPHLELVPQPETLPAPSAVSPPVERATTPSAPPSPAPSPPVLSLSTTPATPAPRAPRHAGHEMHDSQETLAFAPSPSSAPAASVASPAPSPAPTPIAASPPANTVAAPAPSPAPPPVAAPAIPAAPTFNLATAHVEVGSARSNNAAATGSVVGRAISPYGARFTDCYRAALAQAASASPGAATLHLESDDQGYVTTARVTGAAPDAAARCIERITRSVRIDVDTGTANADVPLTFKPL